MLMPFQAVPKIHAWKQDGVIFLMKSTSKDMNGQKHARINDKDKNQKENLLLQLRRQQEGTEDDVEGGHKSYKVSKVAIGETTLVCTSDVDALDENENEVKLSVRKVFTDDKKKEKYYRYTLPRLVCSMVMRQAQSVLLVTKDEEDCVKEAVWLSKVKQVLNEGSKSPVKISWSLAKSTAFLHRFCYLVHQTLEDVEERTVVTFFKTEKREVEVQVEDFECDQLICDPK